MRLKCIMLATLLFTVSCGEEIPPDQPITENVTVTGEGQTQEDETLITENQTPEMTPSNMDADTSPDNTDTATNPTSPFPSPGTGTGTGTPGGSGNGENTPGGSMPMMPTDPMTDPMSDGLRCNQLGGCINTCTDQACVDLCFATLDAEGLMKYEAIVSCVDNSGCGDDNACIDAACEAEFEACSFDRYEFGDGTCSDLFDCSVSCEEQEGDETCYSACQESLTREAFDLWGQFISCAQEQLCPSLSTCAEVCPNEYAVCAGAFSPADPEPDPEPALEGSTCTSTWRCYVGCDNRSCRQGCRLESDPAELQNFNALKSCADTSDCDLEVASCIESTCAAEVFDCFDAATVPMLEGGTQPGGVDPESDPIAACTAYSECVYNCEGEQSCESNCESASSLVGVMRYQGIDECVSSQCTQGSDASCAYTSCRTEFESCYGAEIFPSGMSSCGAFFGCITNCEPDDETCQNTCYNSLSFEGFTSAVNLDYCVSTSFCPPEDTECLNFDCGEEFAACYQEDPIDPVDVSEREGIACQSLFSCVDTCFDAIDSAACEDDCRQSFVEGLGAYDAVNTCLDNECESNPDFFQCAQSSCLNEIDRCFPLEVQPQGDGTCSDYFDCTFACFEAEPGAGVENQQDACFNGCIASTSYEEYNKMRMYFACMDDNIGCENSDDPRVVDSCYSTACRASSDACFGQ